MELDVGVAGAGRMGDPIIRRLLERGHRVHFFDPDPRAGGGLEALGARRVAAAAELGAMECSLSVVPDGDALLALVPELSSGGGRLHLSMSTVGPASAVAAAGCSPGTTVIDAPVSGSVALARGGALMAMVGAAPGDYQRVLPLLRELTSTQILVGPPGAGSAMKLAVNAVVAATNQAVAEALAVAEAHGIEPDAAYAVLEASVVESPYLRYKREAFLDPGGPVAGSIAMLAKDVRLALDAAATAGLELPGTAGVHVLLDAARADGLGGKDVAAMRLWLERRQPTASAS